MRTDPVTEFGTVTVGTERLESDREVVFDDPHVDVLTIKFAAMFRTIVLDMIQFQKLVNVLAAAGAREAVVFEYLSANVLFQSPGLVAALLTRPSVVRGSSAETEAFELAFPLCDVVTRLDPIETYLAVVSARFLLFPAGTSSLVPISLTQIPLCFRLTSTTPFTGLQPRDTLGGLTCVAEWISLFR